MQRARFDSLLLRRRSRRTNHLDLAVGSGLFDCEDAIRRLRTTSFRVESSVAETVTQVAYEVPKHLKLALLVALLQQPGMESVLVFSRTKHGADRIARKLESSDIQTATLHSNRTQNQRLRALAAFKAGTVRVLVATDMAALGGVDASAYRITNNVMLSEAKHL